MSMKPHANNQRAPMHTTSVARFDGDGQLIDAGGEFGELAELFSSDPLRNTILAEYLARFRMVNRAERPADADAMIKLIAHWADPTRGALEAETAAGSWRLLSSFSYRSNETVFISTNIDDQKHRQDFVQFMMENHPVPAWANDAETGEVIYSNPLALDLYGVGPDAQENRNVKEYITHHETNRSALEQLRETGRVNNLVVQTSSESGEEIWVNGCATLARYNGRDVVISAIQDLTDRQQVDDDTRKAHDILRDAIESLTEGFALYDEDRCLVMCNTRYKEMNRVVADLLEPGLDWEILMRESARRGVYSDAIGREEAWISDRIASGVEYIQDYELKETDGSHYLVSVHPTKLGGFVVTRTDITAKKEAEAAERDGDLLVRKVLDASPANIVMARMGDGRIIFRTQAAQELFGNTQSAVEHYVSPEDRADYITDLLSDGTVEDYEVKFFNAKGEPFSALVSGRIAEYKGEEVVVSSVVDLTEQIEAEALVRQVLEACQVPVQMTKAKSGEILFMSKETRDLFGSVGSAKSYYADPNTRETYLKTLREKGSVSEYRAEYINAKGQRFWGAVSARLIEFNGEEVIVSNTRDLTDELAMQKELAEQRDLLFQNEKMSALGELLAGVAHELNNPLSIVVGHSLMLREDVSDPDSIRRVDKISNAAERCSKIVKTFLAMARQQPAKMELTNINQVISTAVDVAGYGRQNEDLSIQCNLHDKLPDTSADADQITQVIINLLLNAEQAITKAGEGNKIEVSTGLSQNREMIEIVIEDNGPGIPDSIKPRIFEPFFTTKEVGDGTGIGLAFCHRIIHSHGGNIRLGEPATTGSRFVISLPLSNISEPAEAQGAEDAKIKGSIRALVVDDEIEVGELVAEMLIKEGIQIDLVHSADDAVTLLSQNTYDLLLSDLNMPGLGGRGLFDALKSDFPDMLNRTGFITGDTMGSTSQKFLQESKRPYLEKPVSPTELAKLVNNLLNDNEDSVTHG